MTQNKTGILSLVMTFVEVAKSLRPEFIEHWLNGKVNDYDMDMILIEEKKHRAYTYKNLIKELIPLQDSGSVK